MRRAGGRGQPAASCPAGAEAASPGLAVRHLDGAGQGDAGGRPGRRHAATAGGLRELSPTAWDAPSALAAAPAWRPFPGRRASWEAVPDWSCPVVAAGPARRGRSFALDFTVL